MVNQSNVPVWIGYAIGCMIEIQKSEPVFRQSVRWLQNCASVALNSEKRWPCWNWKEELSATSDAEPLSPLSLTLCNRLVQLQLWLNKPDPMTP